MAFRIRWEHTVDTTQAEAKVKTFRNLIYDTNRAMISNIRYVGSFVSNMLYVVGGATNQMFGLVLDATVTSLEAIIAIRNAAAEANPLAFAGRIALTTSSAILLWVTIAQLQRGKQDSARRFQALAMGMRMLAWRPG